MTVRDSSGGSAGGATSDPQEVRQEIERTRQELGDTVEALAYKADVKSRVQERVANISQRAQATGAQGARTVRDRRAPLAAIGGAVLLVGLAILWRRRRA
jgi:Protein of unknown function (DUF3618)